MEDIEVVIIHQRFHDNPEESLVYLLDIDKVLDIYPKFHNMIVCALSIEVAFAYFDKCLIEENYIDIGEEMIQEWSDMQERMQKAVICDFPCKVEILGSIELWV